uniref:NADH-ubiquinone oxidoreductase chain 6 n=1 Tax=Indochinamon bhumibol TaxID=2771976 RepID=A0A7H9SV10_9EUCA|nr:NADH dehydrogenase subunit 6 [Indochinamon bhumibol]QNT10763.1 NADH dehydrogenase subunit 6 [Indochinamon bhumibol]BCL51425.1 NADH dehydrogenase subunit 6 [Indochinamon bhumibol]
MMYIVSMITILSLLFTRLNHPLAMGLNLLAQTIIISLSTGLASYSFWFSYTLFLIFLGGMLVLFIYVASLASNEFFALSSTMIIFMVGFLSISTFIIFFDLILIPILTSLPNSSINVYSSTSHITSWIFNTPSMFFTFFIISYLLFTLLVVVKIINLFKGPLRLSN